MRSIDASAELAANGRLLAEIFGVYTQCMHLHVSTTRTLMDKKTEDLTRFGSSWGSELCQAIHQDENKHDRALRLYQCPGGALLGWLFDEARLRQQTLDELAENLGVTPGYLMQISRGLRPASQISQALTVACARYLGVAPVVIKLVSGSLSMADFTTGVGSSESELPALDVLRELPDLVRWLQRAALESDESQFAAIHGHRDTSIRR
jgi:transcriptional regulator with XRE-family HTH domain